MGPSFNFYKFKGAQDQLKNKFRETSKDVKWVDNVLIHKWGEQTSGDRFNFSKFKTNMSNEESNYESLLLDPSIGLTGLG